MTDCQPIEHCTACDSTHIRPFFDLGTQPLANSYKLQADDAEPVFPLATVVCEDCAHVQLTHAVDPDLLFRDYAYVSGVSRTMLEFFEWFAIKSLEQFDVKPDCVLDIGCNDGSQLDVYKKLGLETWGVDPAENLAKATSQRHNIICDYFRQGLTDQNFDLVTIQNAFAHNNNQFDMLLAAKSVLSDSGLLFIQTSQGDMVLNGEFDTIYHEHISFYNTKSMSRICERAGLNLINVLRHPIHGNSYIFVISQSRSNPDKIAEIIQQEQDQGVYSTQLLDRFRLNAEHSVAEVVKVIERCRARGLPVVGFGAPAKGNTFLNYAKIKLDFIIDETPQKRNKYTPGMSIPIEGIDGFDRIDNQPCVCFVILAWNFYNEIHAKIQRQRNLFKGAKQDIFVTCFPKFREE
jgi:ubiquinone/menaquinone biosynthesis C-methylase UbiE